MKKAAVILIIILAAAVAIMGYFLFQDNNFGISETETEDVVVKSISKEKEIVVLRLGVADVIENQQYIKLFGKNIAGTGKNKVLIAEYVAKLGITGSDVVITKVSDKEYDISIPSFILIGYSEPTFRTVEGNGALSIFTPEKDTEEMINEILNDEAKTALIDENIELLKESTEEFYMQIINAVDPAIKVNFTFAE